MAALQREQLVAQLRDSLRATRETLTREAPSGMSLADVAKLAQSIARAERSMRDAAIALLLD